MRRRILRLSAWLLSVAVLIVGLLAGAIRLDQYVLRWRGERLQSEIRSLELRKSTYADARQLEQRWFGDAKEGVCRPSWCDLQIFLGNVANRHIEFLALQALRFRVGPERPHQDFFISRRSLH
jgi:hypothetical protein